jgi:hypothetical protein
MHLNLCRRLARNRSVGRNTDVTKTEEKVSSFYPLLYTFSALRFVLSFLRSRAIQLRTRISTLKSTATSLI